MKDSKLSKAPALNLKKHYQNKSHKSKNNPDLKKKKQSILFDVQQKAPLSHYDTEAGTIVFEQGMAVLPDDTRADDAVAELQEKHGLHPDHFSHVSGREGVNTSRTHRYFQGSLPEMPWKKE